MNPRFLSTLGLCMRAGRLNFGFDTVKAAVQEGNVRLMMTACDLSPKTAKEAAFVADKYAVTLLPLPVTMDELRLAMGKKTGVIAVTDEGFAKRLEELYAVREQQSL